MKADLYSQITDKIIAELENGVRPWMKPWAAGHVAGPISRPLRSNGKPYSGINVLMLWATAMERGYSAPIWMTYKQARELGAQVRKGEKGTLVVYASTFTRTETDTATGEERRSPPSPPSRRLPAACAGLMSLRPCRGLPPLAPAKGKAKGKSRLAGKRKADKDGGRKMPRQKKEKADRRTEQVNPRFTPAERVKLESDAIAAGLSASEFVRRMALTGRVVVEKRRGLEHAVFDELKRIGNNINQLARIANQSGRVPARLDQALENLDRILLRELDHDS